MKQLCYVIALVFSIDLPSSHTANAGELIAYVTPSRGNGAIIVSAPDGSDKRTLFEPPADSDVFDALGSLAWSSDGRRLAFSSSHHWKRSLSFIDIYVISREGRDLKRPSWAPDPSRYDDYPKGKVRVVINNPHLHSNEVLVFVDGASKPISFLGRKGTRKVVLFDDVADFGDGVRQYVRVYRQPASHNGPCWFDIGVFADVEPGKIVDAGELSYANNANCTKAWQPTWIDNKQIAFLFIDYPSQLFPPHLIWSLSPDSKPGATAKQLLDISKFSGSDPLTTILAGPEVVTGQQLLLLRPHALGTTISVAPASDVEQLKNISPAPLCPGSTCKIIGVDWRADGSGLFVAEAQENYSNQPRYVSVLYEFDFASGSRREILSLPNEIIGRIAVSPDNGTIAFERTGSLVDAVDTIRYGPRPRCPCSIWLVNVDGSNLRKFAEDGRAPAWTR